MTGVCKKFYEILTRSNSLWKPALSKIRLEHTITCVSVKMKYTNYLNNPFFKNDYERVSAYGNTIRSYRTREKQQKQSEVERFKRKVALRKRRGASLVLTTVLFLVLYYAFLVLLGLKLDNIVDIPTYAIMVPVLVISGYSIFHVFFTMSCGFYSAVTRVLKKVIKCDKKFLFGILCLSLSVFGVTLVSYITYRTGKKDEWIWLFAAMIFLCFVYLIFAFSCVPKPIKRRYNPAFRCMLTSALILFTTSLSIFVYTNLHPTPQTQSIIHWSEWMLVGSYFQMVLYMFLYGLLGAPNTINLYEKFYIGTLELLTSATIFTTTVLGFCKIIYDTNLLWSVILAPMYLTPLLSIYLFWHYHSFYEFNTASILV
eukprot:Phypoly_transcript_09836.p1 GENE.Phypoly_transcript_09836~~Phypoly_transcript_09836.p1  ORF type:complete len:431 (+),score=36.71 Phypoly_transcript_09836:184-1293(+)